MMSTIFLTFNSHTLQSTIVQWVAKILLCYSDFTCAVLSSAFKKELGRKSNRVKSPTLTHLAYRVSSKWQTGVQTGVQTW